MSAILALIAFLILASAVAAMVMRSLIHSALLLIGSWLGIAIFYLWAGAEFAAFAQVLIYVGAVSMVVLFAVLMTRRSREDESEQRESSRRGIWGALSAVAIASILAWAILHSSLPRADAPAPTLPVRRIGQLLAGPEAPSLLVIGVLLTVALIGAVVLAAAPRGGSREDGP